MKTYFRNFQNHSILEREKCGVVLESQIFGMLSLTKLQYVPLREIC